MEIMLKSIDTSPSDLLGKKKGLETLKLTTKEDYQNHILRKFFITGMYKAGPIYRDSMEVKKTTMQIHLEKGLRMEEADQAQEINFW